MESLRPVDPRSEAARHLLFVGTGGAALLKRELSGPSAGQYRLNHLHQQHELVHPIGC